MVIVHILILLATLYFIARSDWLGLQWMRGVKPTLELATLKKYHRNVSIGLVLMVLTGGTMAYFGLQRGAINLPALYVKLAFVAVLIVNSFVIGSHMKRASEVPFASLSANEKLMLYISGAASTLGWLGAIAAAFFIEIE